MEKKIFAHPQALRDVPLLYCPGCHHGIVHRLAAEVIDEFKIREKTVLVGSIGCSVKAPEYFNVDSIGALHGRAPATATGIKRVQPDRIVFTYQGDGDLAAIGTAEIIHAAARGENITVIFVNNAIYGMTGGQMAPTTMEGQITQTTPYGRDHLRNGYPINVAEMLAVLKGPSYIARTAVNTPQRIMETKRALKKAFENQINNLGFSMVEVLSTCPTNWRMNPIDACKWVDSNMIPQYPLGVFKNITEGEAA
ncbi:MAG: 2-oxoglutarate oxidoreductase [Desulfarculales bacterium]|jgi:2-oxoglutarate ferredoxin oxidoreductase subunit beta|nr:2-oxoglutarate oxidoreductase [Desulfarculales bacterium]